MNAQTATAPQNTGTGTDIAHIFCPYCYPAAQLGDSITTLCGHTAHYLGENHSPRECGTCAKIEPQVIARLSCPNCR